GPQGQRWAIARSPRGGRPSCCRKAATSASVGSVRGVVGGGVSIVVFLRDVTGAGPPGGGGHGAGSPAGGGGHGRGVTGRRRSRARGHRPAASALSTPSQTFAYQGRSAARVSVRDCFAGPGSTTTKPVSPGMT